MTKFLALLLFLQVTLPPTGVATGLVLSSSGAPASGVRVYAVPAGDPNAPVTSGSSVFESLAQTDATGRFRLEVPAGRYFIAAGAVDSPTYYPNEANIGSAKVITVTAGTTVDGVNFSRYVPAVSAAGRPPTISPVQPPGSTGLLAGVIRFSDGSPASALTVFAIPVSASSNLASPTIMTTIPPPPGSPPSISTVRLIGGAIRTTTDTTGRYRLQSVSPDTYNIMTGYADSPAFYSSPNGVKAAVTTTPTTNLDNLDLTVPIPRTTSIRLRATAREDRPLGGVTLDLRAAAATGFAGLLPQRGYKSVVTSGDGTVELSGVSPGPYTVVVKLPSNLPITKNVEIKDQPLDLSFAFPVDVLTGRFLWEDGSPFSDPVLNEVAASTISNPNLIATTIFTTSKNGTFSGVLDSDEYRFYVRNLPQAFEIRSITAGRTDLTKELLKFGPGASMDVEVRIAKRAGTAQKVEGKVSDVLSGLSPAADRVQLCCFNSGPAERVSTELRPNGSFEFFGIPAGRYEVELKGKTSVRIVDSPIDVGNQGRSGLTLVSATEFFSMMTSIALEGSIQAPAGLSLPVIFTSSSGPVFQVATSGEMNGWVSVPSGIQYDVSIANLPAGFKVKSMRVTDPRKNMPTIVPPPDSPSRYAGAFRPNGNGSIVITLMRSE